MNTESEIEEARNRDRDLSLRILAVLVPVILALGGWVVSLEGRLQEVTTKQEERGPRISGLETAVKDLEVKVHDPAPKPETKIEMSALNLDLARLDDRITRLEERVNNIHNYLLMLPLRPDNHATSLPLKRGGRRLKAPTF